MNDFLNRVLRRETHSSRAPLSVFAAVVLGLLCVYALLESLLRALGQREWLLDPLLAVRALAGLPEGVPGVLLGTIGVLAMLAGVVFLGNALLPGRRARHVIEDARVAVTVDNEVIASALARRARVSAGVTREQVMVVVSATTVQVSIRPTSGIMLDESVVTAAVESEVAAMGLTPVPTVSVHLARSGVVGV